MDSDFDHKEYLGSQLLRDRIYDLVEKEKILIINETFDNNMLDIAKYNMRLGSQYLKDGQFGCLTETNKVLTIEPYELVFVESYEVFLLPKNITARYDLRISCCLAGISIQTGLQLDPEYKGRTFCALFNFSNERVNLVFKDQLGSIEFSYTTKWSDKVGSFQSPRQGFMHLEDALQGQKRQSGLMQIWKDISDINNRMNENLNNTLKKFEDTATRLHTRVDTMVGAVFAAMAFTLTTLGVLVAAITMMVTQGKIPLDEPGTIIIGIAVIIAVASGSLMLLRTTMRRILNVASKKEVEQLRDEINRLNKVNTKK